MNITIWQNVYLFLRQFAPKLMHPILYIDSQDEK